MKGFKMIEKETELFFKKLLTEGNDIQDNYLEALVNWEKGLFKIQIPFISRHKNKIDIKQINVQNSR